MRSGETPARWRGHLDALLPERQKLTRGHHKAMAFDTVSEFSKQLRKMPSIAPAALKFAILTAARSGEVMGGRWSEVNLPARVWTVPAVIRPANFGRRSPGLGGALPHQ